MATRSSIAMAVPGGIRSIYCHHDGYTEGVGFTLNQHYTDPDKITHLLDLGDISYLSEDVGVWKQDFNDPIPGITLAYGRDRGEAGTGAIIHSNVERWAAHRVSSGCEYGYLWEDGSWSTFAW
jgi:hypothetical protein